ncbi:unnamed protein product [marine sediment metagenome]|uniref:Uncharacterized protein n=1 Tax=marine sediment metagenome TaxID=412755 RepID=X1T8U1_9ZZZZ
MVSAFSLRNKKQELRNLLRNNDVISIADRGVATDTETFDGDTVETDFAITNAGVKNIRSVSISSVVQAYGTDYTFSESDSAITTVSFTSAPASGTDNISINYDYGTGDKIYDELPQDFITIDNYPRIGFDIISTVTKEIAFSGAAFQSNFIIQVNAYGVGKAQSEELIDTIRQLFIDNGDGLFYWNFLSPDSNGPLIESSIKGSKIFQRSLDIRAEFEFEC